MKKIYIEDAGRSMIEMLGVLAIIAVLSVAALAGYSKAMFKNRLNKTIEAVQLTLQRYAERAERNLADFDMKGADAMQNAKDFAFIDDCYIQQSVVSGASSYKTCKLPLGEAYLKMEPLEGKMYSYMYFVTLYPTDPGVCSSFLAANWEEALPDDWWKYGKLWLASEAGEEEIFGQALTKKTMADISELCGNLCPKSIGYCTVVFDFAGYGH